MKGITAWALGAQSAAQCYPLKTSDVVKQALVIPRCSSPYSLTVGLMMLGNRIHSELEFMKFGVISG